MRRPRQTPVADLAALQRDVDGLFERLRAAERQARPAGAEAWSPAIDVYECGDAVVVVAEVPGLAPESLALHVEGNELVLRGERRVHKPASGSWLCVERPHGRFERRVALEAAFDGQRIEARLKDGLLVVTLPRHERRRRPVVIEVKRS